MIISLIFSLTTIAVANAAYTPHLNDGYDVTGNYQGVDVPVGAQVVVTALTIDSEADKVRFIWKNPAG